MDKVAELVLHITFGTLVGPIFFGPFSLVISNALNKLLVDGPPEPIIKPVLLFDISSSLRFESLIASSIDK